MAPHAEQASISLQAVVLSDSYNNRFWPLTQTIPRCLLPLANTPLIEYTFEFLASSGVQEVYVFVSAHAEQIKEYLRASKWSLGSSPFKIHAITSPESMSAGDALRELDTKQLISSDFILVSGDVVSNLNVDDVLKAHRKRREIDKNSIMTMVLREASPFHRTRAKVDSAIYVLSHGDSQLLHYEPIKLLPCTRKISLDPQIFVDHNDLLLRNDVIDCNIDVCSPDVPALFTENFDYQEIRRDFVHGILTSDLLGKTIHAHIVADKYAARVQSLQTYDAISRDIISRWTYPMVPDNNLLPTQTYVYLHGHVYQEQEVVLARSALLKSHVVVGSGTIIGERTILSYTTIGRNSVIGSDCQLTGCYVWSNVKIGSNIRMTGTIIAESVVIGDNCEIGEGVILGVGVHVESGSRVTSDSRIAASAEHMKSVRLTRSAHTDKETYDSDSGGSDDDHNQELAKFSYNMESLRLSDSSVSSLSSEPDVGLRRDSNAQSVLSEESDLDLYFYSLAKADLEIAFQEGHTVDDTMLEMTSLRMRENVAMHEVRVAFINAFVTEIQRQVTEGKPIAMAVENFITKWGLLLSRTISRNSLSEDCKDLLSTLQSECAKRYERMDLFLPLLRFMYDKDVLHEDQIIAWYNDNGSVDNSTESMRSLYKKAGIFVKWLTEAEEEEEEEDSGSNSD